MFNKLNAVQPATRGLVRVLDAREFGTGSYHFASDQSERTLQRSFSKALSLLPNVVSILVDGHPDLDINFLVESQARTGCAPLQMLSIANCPFAMPNIFYASSMLRDLVYADLSAVPGSIWPLLQRGMFAHLRVLKLRSREIDDTAMKLVCSFFSLRLWSLDVSENRLTDDSITWLVSRCFPRVTLRSRAYFHTEGKLQFDRGPGGYWPFVTIAESEWSKTFSHPERYLADSPVYHQNEQDELQEYEVLRMSGGETVRKDSAQVAVDHLSDPDCNFAEQQTRANHGITHLNLSNNQISANGLERLLRTSNGHLEHLACDSLPLLPSRHHLRMWPDMSLLQGVLGFADFCRPVWSSNLRSLRIHHSFVTEILTLQCVKLSSLAGQYLAESIIFARVREMFHGGFSPDMNPRLSVLTLTRIPRRSSGPLTQRLIAFLKQLSEQERAIQDTAESFGSSWRGPGLLSGIRILRLEFEPDALDEGFSEEGDLNAEALMNSGEQGFSFFEDERQEKHEPEVRQGSEPTGGNKTGRVSHDVTGASSPITGYQEFIDQEIDSNEQKYTVKVWLGHPRPEPSSAMHDYQRLVLTKSVRTGVAPASPAQIRAGAPEGCYIFHHAWILAVMPTVLKAPSQQELSAMRDVLAELKEYRLRGKALFTDAKVASDTKEVRLGAPHYFWTGRLEVTTEVPKPGFRSSHYWR